MAIYTDRIVLVFPIAAKNRQAAASLQTLEITDSGKEFETLVPLDPALVGDYAIDFSLPLITENEALKKQVDELQNQVESLIQYRPYNPRIIDATAFFNRITLEEFAKLSTSDDATLVTIAKTIVAYKDNDWPVVFESTEMQGMLEYLTGTGFLTEDRKAELVANASQEEAYNAD